MDEIHALTLTTKFTDIPKHGSGSFKRKVIEVYFFVLWECLG